jgi:hypothetical protein
MVKYETMLRMVKDLGKQLKFVIVLLLEMSVLMKILKLVNE